MGRALDHGVASARCRAGSDFNGDGYADLAIGVPATDIMTRMYAEVLAKGTHESLGTVHLRDREGVSYEIPDDTHRARIEAMFDEPFREGEAAAAGYGGKWEDAEKYTRLWFHVVVNVKVRPVYDARIIGR